MADFVRWHSPRDWVEENDGKRRTTTDQTDKISDGIYHVEADAADSTESASVGFRAKTRPIRAETGAAQRAHGRLRPRRGRL